MQFSTLRRLGVLLFCSILSLFVAAQTPGLIVRPTTAPYSTVLDPNGDGFTSPTNAGFITTDVGVGFSEIPYKIIPPFKVEPTSDLMRGPSDLFSDLVRLNADESGFYVFSTGGATPNLLFRMRAGNIISGSKGYSVLIDADGKFGATGPYADPNYQAATTGSNGNPGFEYEVVLETNFRVAVYNVDGGSSPVLLTSYAINAYSQISLAISNVSNTPDYFYDFYVPLSALAGPATVTASTPLRMSATTVMAPQAAIGGPKSDIFGYDGTDYMKAWETIITSQPAFTANDVTAGGAGIATALCTAAPSLNSPIAAGTVTISGTWTQADATRPLAATITLYKKVGTVETVVGTTSVNTGGTWSFVNVAAADGNVFYAKAQSAGESACLLSNSVQAMGCIPANKTSMTGFTLTCASDRGFDGQAPANAEVRIYSVSASGFTLYADQTTTTFKVNRPGATTRFTYDNVNTNSANPCTGGQADVAVGQYAITIQEPGKCESDFLYANTSGATCTPTATPIITQTVLYTGATTVSGTAAVGATIYLFVNGQFKATTTATGGSYSFATASLQLGDDVEITALTTTTCMSAKASRKVSCFTAPPIINTNTTGNLVSGTTIAGTSSSPVGTTIRLYNNSNTLLATVTVQTGSTWTTGVAAVAGTSYYATAQNGTCGVSGASATAAALNATTACATITGSYNETATSVTGTLNSSFSGKVRLYQDGIATASVDVTSATSWTIPVTAGTLYPGGVLTVTTQSSTGAEKTDCAGSVTVSCAAPIAPAVTHINVTVSRVDGRFVFNLSGSQSGVLYTLEDAATSVVNGNTINIDRSLSVFGTGSSISLTSYAFLAPGTYSLRVNAVKLSGSNCGSTATPVTLVVTDNDGDGVIDPIDLDDDNDGILDVNEAGTSIDATADANNDGIPNYKDPTFCTLNARGVCASLDLDGDGIINQFDLDADNDGIPDIIENGGTDTDNDGKVDGTTDTDGDGLRNAADATPTTGAAGSIGLTVLDFDGDGVPNFRDLDSDGDGILDTRESGLNRDTNNDGVINSSDTGHSDANNDGWTDVIDNLTTLTLRNTDAHGRPDYLDIDADNDGIVDNIEGQTTAGYIAPRTTTPDADGDGINDAYDNNTAAFGGNAANGITTVDTDSDGLTDYRDLDSDNDGYPDAFEGHDSNGDNLPNANSVTKNGVGGTADADGDGLLDGYDNNTGAVNPTNGTLPTQYPMNDGGPNRDWRQAADSDKDGVPDFIDLDDDNDGIPDTVESGGVNPLGDADGDGILNYQDPTPGTGVPAFVDTNGDGISDVFDKDLDGIINSLDLDSDNDGIPDVVEAGGVDANGDGRIDNFSDTDNDGLSQNVDANNTGAAGSGNGLGAQDKDGDGIANQFDLDSDNDGIPDLMEAGGTDANNDGRVDNYTDLDGDGFASIYDGDANNDGVAENTAAALIPTGADANNDGRPESYPKANLDAHGWSNPYDLDSDGDGILDSRESGLSGDTNNNGILSDDPGYVDANGDGWSDAIDALASLNLTNTDGAGKPNFLDIDSDDDGLSDNVEGQTTAGYLPPLGTDADGDGIDDQYDNNDASFGGNNGNGIVPNNHDGADEPDYMDLDSDNDTDPDRVEGNDLNGNARADDLSGIGSLDSDGDGLLDFFDNSTAPDVTIAGFGSGTGSRSTAQQTLISFTDRDWRNNGFSLTAYALPVRFVSVRATQRSNGTHIEWQVAEEQNVLHYEVERSFNGSRFEKVGTVAYQQAGTTEMSYGFIDAFSGQQNRYYRIRQVDLDGKAMYSATVMVRAHGSGGAPILQLYPNPATTASVVVLEARSQQKVQLTVVDATGGIVARQAVQVQKGSNAIPANLMQTLAKGVYVLLADVDGQRQQVKFIK
jgi:hypothetical protein